MLYTCSHSPISARSWSDRISARPPSLWPLSWTCPRTPACPAAWSPSWDRCLGSRAPRARRAACAWTGTRRTATGAQWAAQRETWTHWTAGSTTICGPAGTPSSAASWSPAPGIAARSTAVPEALYLAGVSLSGNIKADRGDGRRRLRSSSPAEATSCGRASHVVTSLPTSRRWPAWPAAVVPAAAAVR